VVFFVIALADHRDDLKYNRARANEAYDNQPSWRATCDRLNAKKAAGTFETSDNFLYADCSADHSGRHAAEVREQSLREMNEN
jgi:hypothetical protein